MGEFHDEQTLFKVRDALRGRDGDFDSERLTEIEVYKAISRIQNAGILFREFIESVPAWGEVEPVDENGEYAPLKKEEYIRITALEQAVASAVPGFSDELPVIKRARYFEQYIRNGAFENAET